jgi:hypothetical protein
MRKHPSTLASALVLGLSAWLLPARANAGCGFYAPPATASGAALVNDADQVALMREGTRLALTMSTNYKGPAEDFAMIVPVPVVLQKESVKTLSPAVFQHLEKMTAPRVVEYDELDPCRSTQPMASAVGAAPGGAVEGTAKGGGGGGVVKIEAQFVSGEYDIVVLSATESDGLEKWLIDNHYKIPAGASAALAPYVAAQQKFVVAKVDSKRVIKDESGAVVLSPLRFVYETNDFRLPVRLGLLNAPPGGKQDVIVYVLARGRRVESANYPNAFAPTNVDVDEKVIDRLGSFHAALFDATVKKAAGKGIVTEYAWNAAGCGNPCTADPLSTSEIDKLGADDLLGSYTPLDLALTRVHARYDATTLSEDIVFRTADPIAGGGEGDPGADTTDKVENGVLAFQTKYAVRHAWAGDLDCANPIRGTWTPRSSGMKPPATGLAAVPRDVALDQLVKSPIKALGLGPQTAKYGALSDVAPPRKKGSGSESATPPWTWIAVGGVAVLLVALSIFLARKSPRPS